jgi:hypothetical protein
VQPGCNTQQCCCFHEQVMVTRSSPDYLNVSSGLTGQCLGESSFQRQIPDPKGFTGSFIFGDLLYITLSSDSRTITVTNPRVPACSGKAVKNGAVKQHLNIGIPLMALILLQRIMNFSKI